MNSPYHTYLVVSGLETIPIQLFNDVRVYVPTSDGTSWTDGVPQTFLGSTSEPSTLLTLGSSLLGLAGLARKRLFN